MGTITPAHNCRCRSSDVGKYLLRDWKSFPLFYKGKSSCKSIFLKKQFPTDSVNHTCPVTQYISDHRPRGLSLQQLDSAKCFFETIGRISLSCFLNGTVGYRTYSEDSKRVQGGFTVFDLSMCKTEYENNHRDSRYMFGTEV